jgi:hypothetical protein
MSLGRRNRLPHQQTSKTQATLTRGRLVDRIGEPPDDRYSRLFLMLYWRLRRVRAKHEGDHGSGGRRFSGGPYRAGGGGV